MTPARENYERFEAHVRHRHPSEETREGAYFLTDRGGIIREASPLGATMLGASARALLGRSLLAFVDAPDTSTLHELLAGVAVRGVELQLRLRHGLAPRRMHARVIGEGRSEILWTIGARRESQPNGVKRATTRPPSAPPDIEHVRALQRALRERESELARAHERIADLERADCAKDRFLAVLSHDLRGPLNAVLGWAQLLGREHLEQATRGRAVAAIERSARAQLALVEELLDLARIAAEKLQLELVTLDLTTVVRRNVEMLETVARERGIELAFASTSAPVVIADVKRLEQVTTNLVTNAIKFTPPGGNVAVVVDTYEHSARIRVSDDGRGIREDLLPHVFDRLRQGESTSTTREGLGLGLYIVRQLVELHGGTAVAESLGEGRGSTFTVLLPLRSAEPLVEALGPPRPPRAEIDADLTGFRVLVVDDDPDSLDLVAELLQRHGAEVVVTGDVVDAISLFDSCAPDVVISDLDMPGRDGFALIRHLRLASKVPAIALTGFASDRDAERAVRAGFVRHLAKPVETGALVAAVREVLALE